jgi:hypothetical protein
MTKKTFVFQCNSGTYMDCVERNLFGSNKPWPLEIQAGDYCLLHHYEVGSLLGLWTATSNGGRNLVPKIWGGKFPFQVKVKLAIHKLTEVPSSLLTEIGMDPAIGRFDDCIDEELAIRLVQSFSGTGGEDIHADF